MTHAPCRRGHARGARKAASKATFWNWRVAALCWWYSGLLSMRWSRLSASTTTGSLPLPCGDDDPAGWGRRPSDSVSRPREGCASQNAALPRPWSHAYLVQPARAVHAVRDGIHRLPHLVHLRHSGQAHGHIACLALSDCVMTQRPLRGADQGKARCHSLLSHALPLANELFKFHDWVIQQRCLGAPGAQADFSCSAMCDCDRSDRKAVCTGQQGQCIVTHRSSALVVALSALLFSALFSSAFCRASCIE